MQAHFPGDKCGFDSHRRFYRREVRQAFALFFPDLICTLSAPGRLTGASFKHYRMRRRILNILSALAIIGGLVLGALGHGPLAFLAAVAITYSGAITLISGNTDWITNYGGK